MNRKTIRYGDTIYIAEYQYNPDNDYDNESLQSKDRAKLKRQDSGRIRIYESSYKLFSEVCISSLLNYLSFFLENSCNDNGFIGYVYYFDNTLRELIRTSHIAMNNLDRNTRTKYHGNLFKTISSKLYKSKRIEEILYGNLFFNRFIKKRIMRYIL